MNRLYICLALMITLHARAQTLSPFVLSSAGAHFEAGGYSLSWTAGETVTETFATPVNMLSQGFQQPELDLKIAVIDSFCIGFPLDIPFYATGYIGNSHLFTAELSDSSGSFASPVALGSISANASDTIAAAIPSGLPESGAYRIRIISTLPVRISTGNPADATLCPVDLMLGLYIEGFYNSGGIMTSPLYNSGISSDTSFCDSVTVELHYNYSPFSIFYSETKALSINGSVLCSLPAAAAGNEYYIALRFRNAIETWSKSPVMMGMNTSYDFRY